MASKLIESLRGDLAALEKVSHELSAVLERIREAVPMDYAALEAAMLTTEKRAQLGRMLAAVGYTLGDRVGGAHQLSTPTTTAKRSGRITSSL